MIFRNEYWYLSNMYPTIIKDVDGRVYSCVEAAFQAQKCVNEADKDSFVGIDGFSAKKLGRRVQLRMDWETIKLREMERILRIKFRDSKLMNQLKSITGDIVEDNNWRDTYWGKCNGVGSNHLGLLLMKLRDE